jgi:hypothetical protein
MASFFSDPGNEFHKLNEFDKRLFIEVLEKYSKSITMWIEYTAEEYARKGITIDVDKFKMEAEQLMKFTASEDQGYAGVGRTL